ncbi:unnamed protein product [Moneuplotes crassus]|uniref:Hexose transporter 1 n=1 Tax=Euplotes crassus TaxID=5936 RepID=A0AAD1U9W4_EUPCR|nr:unnamed protein product [Moneuplotes crassus]
MGHFHFGYLMHTMFVLWNYTPCIYGFNPNNTRVVNMAANIIFLIMAAISGGFSWKFSRYGKRKALIISALLCLSGSGILYIRSLYAMTIGRGIVGLGFGITSAIAPLFVSEISAPKYIEYCIVITQLWFNIGFIIPLFLSFSFPRVDAITINLQNSDDCSGFGNINFIWREMVVPITLIPVLQLILLLIVFKTENPLYRQSYKDNSSSLSLKQTDDYMFHSGVNYDEDSQQSTEKSETLLVKDTWSNLWKFSERKKIFASCMVRGFQQLTGVHVLLNYGLSFVYDSRIPRINLSFTITCASVVFLIPSVFMLKKFGRKKLFMAAMIITCFCCCILFQLTDQLTLVDNRIPIFGSTINLASAIMVWIYFISFWLNFASTPILYCTETLSDKGMAIVTAFHWSVISLVISLPSLAMHVIEQIYGRPRFRMANSFFFFLFSGAAMLGFFCASLYIIETKGKSKMQLSEEFKERVFSLKNSKIYKK